MLKDAYVCGITMKICMNGITRKIIVVGMCRRSKGNQWVHKEYFWVLAVFDFFLEDDYKMLNM